MKKLFVILFLVCFTGEVFSQDLDFLDKVNEKPKAVVKPKEETEAIVEKKAIPVNSVLNPKKKKEKKKKSGTEVVNPSGTPLNTVPTNANNQPNQPIVNQPVVNPPIVSKTVTANTAIPTPEVGEISNLPGTWLDPEIRIEPSDLIGFVSVPDINDSESKTGKEIKNTEKQGEGFFGFFDKYKKAMLILGFIILFAFYRLKMSKPSSNSRSYRR